MSQSVAHQNRATVMLRKVCGLAALVAVGWFCLVPASVAADEGGESEEPRVVASGGDGETEREATPTLFVGAGVLSRLGNTISLATDLRTNLMLQYLTDIESHHLDVLARTRQTLRLGQSDIYLFVGLGFGNLTDRVYDTAFGPFVATGVVGAGLRSAELVISPSISVVVDMTVESRSRLRLFPGWGFVPGVTGFHLRFGPIFDF